MDRPEASRSTSDWIGRGLALLALAVSVGISIAGRISSPPTSPPGLTAPPPVPAPTTADPTRDDRTSGNDHSPEVARRARPSVVRITTFAPEETAISDAARPDEVRNTQGSGLVARADGSLITCYHVVRGAQRILVDLADDRQFEASVVGFDAQNDLAVLRIPATDLIPVVWGAAPWPEAGSAVWAIGHPFGGRQMISRGLVAGPPSPNDDTATRNLLQSDVAMQPGHSGGGWFNANGEVIGVATSIGGKTFQGLSFAIPSSAAKRSIESLLGGAATPPLTSASP